MSTIIFILLIVGAVALIAKFIINNAKKPTITPDVIEEEEFYQVAERPVNVEEITKANQAKAAEEAKAAKKTRKTTPKKKS